MATEVGDVRWFIDVAYDGMVGIVAALGDEGANARPLPGANSPYCVLAHCLGVTEFRAAGSVGPLLERVSAVRWQLDQDLQAYQAESPPRQSFEDAWLPVPMTQRGCLLHLYEELAQHHGQMEILRDAIVVRG